MKKTILALVCLFGILLTSCWWRYPSTPIYSYREGTHQIMVDSSMIDTFDNYGYEYTYQFKNAMPVAVSGETYTVSTSRYTGWTDNGYQVIQIKKGDKVVALLESVDGFARLGRLSRSNDDCLESIKEHFFIEAPISPYAKALIFAGWRYGGEPSYLTVFVLTDEDVKLVYNQMMDINQVDVREDGFSLIVQSNEQQTGDGVTWDLARTHTIYTKDGMLWFKDNPILESSKYRTIKD